MCKILKLTAFKRLEKLMNSIYTFATKFITIFKHLSLQKRNKKEQGRNVRRANGLKILTSQKERKRSKKKHHIYHSRNTRSEKY